MMDQANESAGGGENIAIDMRTVETMVAAQQATEAQRDAVQLADHFGSLGIDPESDLGVEVRQYVAGTRKVTAQNRALAEGKLKAWSRDKQFQTLLFEGDAEATRLFTVANAMMAAEVEGS
jgi:hypothetical protein